MLSPSINRMCGRYSITIDQHTTEERFGAKFVSGHFEPTYNAAPSHLFPIIRTYAPHEIVLAKWGFIPEAWRAKELKAQINARVETADEKPMFSASFRARHCLVLCDGFYEWKTVRTRSGILKQPYRFVLKSGEPFAMAGIYARKNRPTDINDQSNRVYARTEGENSPLNFAILTTAANDDVRPIHHRMPIILTPGKEKSWLPPLSGMPILPPFPAGLLTSYPVSPKLNSATFNDRSGVIPMELGGQQERGTSASK